VATYALIHGAGDSGAAWGRVASELEARGHRAVAPDLPCDEESAGWEEHAAVVLDAVGQAGDLRVVAHSLGGFTAALVCSRVHAESLTYVAGMVPEPGETLEDFFVNTAARGAPDDPIEAFLADLPREEAERALAAARPQLARATGDPLPIERPPDVPTRYLLCREDRTFPPDWTRAMVRERLGIVPDEIDGAHCPFLSRPADLAAYLA
jgi:pimeloyl-ACP methyl ester carboxylesterase